MNKSELAKAILYSFINGLSTAKDKKAQLKKLIDDFEIALKESAKEENQNQRLDI